MPVHVVQRGNNRQICFASDEDMAAYANWLLEGTQKFGIEIHAWVLLSRYDRTVLPEKPVRQWVLSVPFQLRYLCSHP